MKFDTADFKEILDLITDINQLDVTDSVGVAIEYDRESDQPILGMSIAGEIEHQFEDMHEAKVYLQGFFMGLNNARTYGTVGSISVSTTQSL